MKENGQLSRIWKKYESSVRQDCVSGEASPLTMNNVATAFVFLFGGMCLMLATLLAEMVVASMKEVKDDQEEDRLSPYLSHDENDACKETEQCDPLNYD